MAKYGIFQVMIKLLDENKDLLVELAKKGMGLHKYKPSDDLGIEGYMDLAYYLKNIFLKLESINLIKFNKIIWNDSGYNEDIFFKTYNFLLKENLVKAYELAIVCNMAWLNELHKDGVVPERFLAETDGFINDLPFGFDLSECVFLEIEVLENLLKISVDIEKVKNEDVSDDMPKPYCYFDSVKSLLYIRGTPCRVTRKYSKQYDFLKIIFSDPKKDWQFSEISEIFDPLETPSWKKLHNYVGPIEQKIASFGFKDFFISTTQSVKINPEYSEKFNFDLDHLVDDF